ncbi:DNA-binding transcriptional regulator SgrR of sgrS sRNA, contains a MarR-type HTH domain and a solute-binding domain [Paenibacillus sophorae]|uniref:DNA-binding transcriptional regulator SgrR of sgrS sRNA, contains a MarR-type HTH domain and a solute-binding domain n=1 Tax=Paenibacillus sophorae TaxID=1333845 RepID=A0A1H8UNU4_9BACL|nr:ABC transporter substrate-binding protein [Paenibacillus sophorae]QWU13330.1 SgrR family transcriptional regulator [Paenibacillus sophorae]SEP04869.1 DNA-binding transcriptional regulator SgrR of sgrS sRNA, contains a MarR-type HTH domain and a solute-binding domain [Paenibacillus sophorae]
MKLHGQYMRLRAHYGSTDEVSATLDELAAILGCTHRNVLNILGKMARQGWVAWTPSRGRGRRSLLSFIASRDDIAVQSMMQAMERRDAVSAAMEQIRSHAGVSALQDTLQSWLLAYSGHHAEMRKDRVIDTLRLPIRQPLYTIDPLHMNLLAESFVSSHVFDGLVRRGAGSEEVLPGIAHAWETDETRTNWTFYLRKEVLLHNGAILDASDVVYSFSRLTRTPQGRLYSFILRDILEVRALNPRTVSIRLKAPNELFLSFLCTSRAAVVPREPERTGESRLVHKPVGTGPFKIAELNREFCVLEAFPHYFQGRAHLDRVEILHVPWDAEPPVADSGSPFHIIQNPLPEESASLSRTHTETSVRKFITCNTKKAGPLSDPAVRAEILSCLDGINEPDGGIGATGPDETANRAVLSGRSGSHHLSAAGKTASFRGLSLRIATIPQYAADAELVAMRLARRGISAAIVSVPPEEFKGQVRMESDLILFSLVRDRDEQLRLFDLYQTLAEHVTPQIRSEIEAGLNLIAREPDYTARAEAFRRIEDRLIQERELHILFEKPVETAYLPSVRGVRFNSQGWIDLRHVWFPQQ